MKKYLFFLILIGLTYSKNQTVLYFTDFNKTNIHWNNKSWKQNDNNFYSVYIEDGYYKNKNFLTTMGENISMFPSVQTETYFPKNILIETKLIIISNNDNRGFGIIFGEQSSDEKKFQFNDLFSCVIFYPSGKVQNINSKLMELANLPKPNIKLHGISKTNIIKVECGEIDHKVYINNTNAIQFENIHKKINRIGFVFFSKQEIWFDYLKLEKIN